MLNIILCIPMYFFYAIICDGIINVLSTTITTTAFRNITHKLMIYIPIVLTILGYIFNLNNTIINIIGG